MPSLKTLSPTAGVSPGQRPQHRYRPGPNRHRPGAGPEPLQPLGSTGAREGPRGTSRDFEGCAGNPARTQPDAPLTLPDAARALSTTCRFRRGGPAGSGTPGRLPGMPPVTPAEPSPDTAPGSRQRPGRPARRARRPAAAPLPRPAGTCSSGPPLCPRPPAKHGGGTWRREGPETAAPRRAGGSWQERPGGARAAEGSGRPRQHRQECGPNAPHGRNAQGGRRSRAGANGLRSSFFQWV